MTTSKPRLNIDFLFNLSDFMRNFVSLLQLFNYFSVLPLIK